MAILKNDPVYPFEKGNYCKPYHIIVKGSWKEIGFDLATIGKDDYGVQLLPYFSPVYGQARREYWAQNWPHVAELQKGVLKQCRSVSDGSDRNALGSRRGKVLLIGRR